MICIPINTGIRMPSRPSTGSNHRRYYAKVGNKVSPSQQVVVAVRGGSVNESTPLSLSFEAAVKAYLKNPSKTKCPLPSNALEKKYLDDRKNLKKAKMMGIRVLQFFAVFVPLALFISIYKFLI